MSSVAESRKIWYERAGLVYEIGYYE